MIVVDDFWTAELERLAHVGAVLPEEIGTLQEAVFDLHRGLAEIQPLARELRMMLDSDLTEEEVDEAMDKLASGASQPEVASQWREALPDYSFRGAAIAACDYIVEEAARESNDIAIKFSQLQEGSIPTGDLGRRMKCALILMATAATVVGAASGVAAAAAAGLAGAALTWTWVGAGGWSAGAAATGVLAWSQAQCPGLLASIGQLRRA